MLKINYFSFILKLLNLREKFSQDRKKKMNFESINP